MITAAQRRFKMLVNDCPDIFWTTDHFVTKPGVVRQHHKPECHAEKLAHCVQCQGRSEGLYNKNWLFLLYLLNWWSVCNQTWSIVQHHEPECPVEKWDYCVQGQGHSKGSKCQWMFVPMIFSQCAWLCLLSISWSAQPFFAKLGMVLYYHEAMCYAEKLVH